jgi:hypothetical protein
MDFTKFVSLLDKSALFFSRADKLGDSFEGSFSMQNREMRPIIYADKIPESAIKSLMAFMKAIRPYTLINCWHQSTHESAAMWKLYARESDGIAIKTEFMSLKLSITSDEDVYIGKVNYADYDKDFIPEGDSFSAFLYKRQDFNHEREVRAIVRLPRPTDGEKTLSEDPCEIGEYFDVDLSLLIKEIVVAPCADDWFLDLIQSVTVHRYGLEVPVVRSDLAQKPIWE